MHQRHFAKTEAELLLAGLWWVRLRTMLLKQEQILFQRSAAGFDESFGCWVA